MSEPSLPTAAASSVRGPQSSRLDSRDTRLVQPLQPAPWIFGREMADAEWKDPVTEAYKRDVDRTLLKKNLRLTPQERILAAMELQRLAEEARPAGRAAKRGR